MSSSESETDSLHEQSLTEVLRCYDNIVKPSRNVFDRMVTIIIGDGPASKQFQIHRGLLCHHSGLFKKLLNGRFKDNDSHVLPAEDPDTFQLFYDWLYSGEVVCDEAMDLHSKAVVNLYFFADFHIVQQLKDRALELYFLRFLKDWEASQNLTRVVYEKTAGNSSLRKLHVDILIETFGFQNLRAWMDEDPKEYLVDLLEVCRIKQIAPGSCSAFNQHTQWVEEKKVRFCELYHEHSKVESYPVYESVKEDPVFEQSTSQEQVEATPLPETRYCFACGLAGHLTQDCPPRGPLANVVCWNCDKKGHKFWKCPEPRDWSKAKCIGCKEMGHTVKRCPYILYKNE